jgi:hypothetical protein
MMAGIYERDNINYPSILAAVAQARARDAERRGDYINQQGQLLGNTAKNLVNTAGRAVVGNMDNGPESWSFAAEGDRSGLDRLRAEDFAWDRMKAEQEHAEKLAKAQREAQKSYDEDKLMQQYRDALATRDAFAQTMNKNNKNDMATYQKYNNAVEYYEKKLGLKNEEPKPSLTEAQKMAIVSQSQTEEAPDTVSYKGWNPTERKEAFETAKKIAPFTNEVQAKLNAYAAGEEDEARKKVMLDEIAALGDTVEVAKEKRDKKIAEQKAKDDATIAKHVPGEADFDPKRFETYFEAGVEKIRLKQK